MKRVIHLLYITACLALLAGILSGNFGKSITRSTAQAIVSTETVSFEAENPIIQHLNSIREQSGLRTLKESGTLNEIAMMRARDMAARQYYAHTTPERTNYVSIMPKNYQAMYSCENLDLVVSTDPLNVINDWMNSSKGHRDCMLQSKVHSMGVAILGHSEVAVGGEITTLYVVVAIHSAAK